MIKDLNSDKKNELRFIKTVLTSVSSLFIKYSIINDNSKFYQKVSNQYYKELQTVLDKISYDSIKIINVINDELINKISDFRCTFIINKSLLIRNNMIESLCKFISKKQFELDSLVN